MPYPSLLTTFFRMTHTLPRQPSASAANQGNQGASRTAQRGQTTFINWPALKRTRNEESLATKRIYMYLFIYIYTIKIMYIHTWNPNDPCFDWKRHCFEGFNHQNRGQTGSRYIYIYVYIYVVICIVWLTIHQHDHPSVRSISSNQVCQSKCVGWCPLHKGSRGTKVVRGGRVVELSLGLSLSVWDQGSQIARGRADHRQLALEGLFLSTAVPCVTAWIHSGDCSRWGKRERPWESLAAVILDLFSGAGDIPFTLVAELLHFWQCSRGTHQSQPVTVSTVDHGVIHQNPSVVTIAEEKWKRQVQKPVQPEVARIWSQRNWLSLSPLLILHVTIYAPMFRR